ncbi:MAG TPA: tRNA threonylcarbamoyladenosine dehydratase [Candidatus Coprenecus stercoravium]|uniref:tRNA threonylcarbamoyladenosine dehydratase n=1 Tax=Candidatus Coprenecus stercoravium TaxID=2840735 RepID=A0A9D2GPU0_9BACT|nr:tRNA threonylcarbamoyladenosine dehydratase [Candidatus Coprenecus stercoravium]
MTDSPEWLGRTGLLLGREALERLSASTIVVAGLGGVGAYAAEMTARAGTGRMVLIDSDRVSVSNKNRQLLALDSTLGQLKTDVMEARLLDINPELEIIKVPEYLTEDNIGTVIGQACGGTSPDFLIDAIDTLAPKISLITYCVRNGIPLVSSMGAGAKTDATRIRLTDLSKSFNCPLAFILRKKLRKAGITKGFQVVFSEELPDRDAIVPTEGERNKKSQVGTISYIPAVFGCVCAQAAITGLTGHP